MYKKKNQKPTTNQVADKQADGSQTKKPNPTQATPLPQIVEDKIQTNTIHKGADIY